MIEITHRHVQSTSGLRMHIAEAGSGPLVLLLHGFPECWYSWRHQLVALAEAGYHAVAPDQRGYARTGGPARVEDCTILHLVGDVVGLIDALGEDRAVVAGHDWGAPVAWATAQLRPDRVRGVIGLSVPHRRRSSRPPVAALREQLGDGFYMVYFQQPDVPEAELDRDRAATFRRLLYAASGDAPGLVPIVPEGGGFLDVCPEPEELPGWLTEDDIAAFVREYEPSGFTGPLNWYRNLDRNWELTAAWHRAPITPPALFIAGDRDLVAAAPGARESVASMSDVVPDLRGTVWLPGCGHWTQQERPDEVNRAMIDFIGSL
ncbi:epoxide hydrolase [Actinomadura rubrobrunea]|uniref:Epoxide hydrolase n=1 Tax=Actinomadura rubrobrunea TaxID=115335 RepID=A0A9W6UWY7_9ACTN|nr:alpha/beta hydrolase [Actinomadura rubrobrunea]GLW66724.1 epoxide hydrolase [Actinomadura rubrobrunea]